MANEDNETELASLLPGIHLIPLEEHLTPIEAFALIKVLDETGSITWLVRSTESVTDEELLGALRVQVLLTEERLMMAWYDGGEERI